MSKSRIVYLKLERRVFNPIIAGDDWKGSPVLAFEFRSRLAADNQFTELHYYDYPDDTVGIEVHDKIGEFKLWCYLANLKKDKGVRIRQVAVREK